MSSIAQPDPDQIYELMEELSTNDLEQVMEKGYYLLASKKAPHLSKRETELFKQINQGFEETFLLRYNELKNKLEEETMTPLENEEFLAMNDVVEAKNVIRLQSIAELAQIRQVSMPVMIQLGLIKHNG
jgi:hypothetical protein